MPIIALTNFLNIPPPDDGEQASFVWVWEAGASGQPRPPHQSPHAHFPHDHRQARIEHHRQPEVQPEPRDAQSPGRRRPQCLAPRHAALDADWVLGAPYSFDPSLLHNPLAFAMSNVIGRYAVRNRMAEVFIEVTRPDHPRRHHAAHVHRHQQRRLLRHLQRLGKDPP